MIEGIEAARMLQETAEIKQSSNVELNPEWKEIGPESAGETQSFADVLSNAINGVDDSIKVSQEKVQSFVAGESDNVHDVMISMQRAKLSFDMMVEVRNKAIETYQEVSRMRI